VVDGVIDTGLHGKPCRDAESAKAEGENRRITKPRGGSRWTRPSRVLLFFAQGIAHAANGVDEFHAAGRLNFRSQLAYEDIERIAFDLPRVAPDSLQQAIPSDHAPGVAHESLQEREFGARQENTRFSAPDRALRGIEYEIGDLQARLGLYFFAPR